VALEAVVAVARSANALGLSAPDARPPRGGSGAQAAVAGEITLERSDVMRGVGRALLAFPGVPPARGQPHPHAIASALVGRTPPRVEKVIVVRHAAQADLLWRDGRDVLGARARW
jgi:acrylyl-CoA reductase (NADPH)/3-hydroxypropionyl-CoA dehydratase/3-hydroxypropionyl-CoA synthetase